MPLAAPEAVVLRDQIRALLLRYITSPFETLRERGAVAQLFNGLRTTPAFGGMVDAHLHPASKLPRRFLPADHPISVGRVQLEFTVSCNDSGCPVEKDVDVVVFNDTPVLRYGGQGAGDVLQQVEASHLAAAIELKASPSGDLASGGEYAKDIFALLWLAEAKQVSTFFVLLDTSLAPFADRSESPDTLVPGSWMEGTIYLRTRGWDRLSDEPATLKTSLRGLGIELSREVPDTPHVEVWSIQCDAARELVPDQRFASLMPGVANRHIRLAGTRGPSSRL